jgi:hypothetical protein
LLRNSNDTRINRGFQNGKKCYFAKQKTAETRMVIEVDIWIANPCTPVRFRVAPPVFMPVSSDFKNPTHFAKRKSWLYPKKGGCSIHQTRLITPFQPH